MGLANPGGGLVGAVVFLGTFHSSWDREACVWEAGPEDHVDFMSDSLPGKAETQSTEVRVWEPYRVVWGASRQQAGTGTPHKALAWTTRGALSRAPAQTACLSAV